MIEKEPYDLSMTHALGHDSQEESKRYGVRYGVILDLEFKNKTFCVLNRSQSTLEYCHLELKPNSGSFCRRIYAMSESYAIPR